MGEVLKAKEANAGASPHVPVDMAAYLAQHEVLHLTPPLPENITDEALPLGNGDLGMMIDASGAQLWPNSDMDRGTGAPFMACSIAKADVWGLQETRIRDVFASKARLRHIYETEGMAGIKRQGIAEGRRGLLEQPPLLGYVSICPELGERRLKAVSELTEYEQRLSLGTAQVTTQYRWQGRKTKVTSLVHAERNVLIFRHEDEAGEPPLRRRCW